MIYLGNIDDSQMKVFVQNEFKNFQHNYPHADLFAIDHNDINLVQNKIESNTVVIYYADVPPLDEGLHIFFKLFAEHSDKTFHMFTMPADWKDLAKWPANTTWNHYNFAPHSHNVDDILGGYRTIDCVTDKNFKSTKIGISLNRLPRSHRLVSLSYMLGLGLNKHCVITAPLLKWHLEQKPMNIMDVVSWDFSKHHNFKHDMLVGWELAKHSKGIFPVTVDAYPPYKDLEPNQQLFNNPENFTNNLVPFYQNSFVEFVCESVYEYDLPWISEKLLNSQLGSNFPIWISGKGTVKWLREHGFDVFDDIIDHSYDTERDPVLRMQNCIADNWKLFADAKRTKYLWTKHQQRFKQNVAWYIRTYDLLLDNSRTALHNCLQ